MQGKTLLFGIPSFDMKEKVPPMTVHAHVSMLQEKHGKLESLIDFENLRPSPDLGMLQTLKKQKLLLKEEIERLRTLGEPRLDAA